VTASAVLIKRSQTLLVAACQGYETGMAGHENIDADDSDCEHGAHSTGRVADAPGASREEKSGQRTGEQKAAMNREFEPPA